MKKVTKFSGYLALVANIFLFIIKAIAGFFSGSIALISDAANSFTDILASIALMFSIKVSHKRADFTHPFGHHRAEPVGGLIVAIIAALLGFEVIRASIMRLFVPKEIFVNFWIFLVVFITIIIKTVLYFYFHHVSRKHQRVAIKALAIDSINDVAVSSLVMVNFIIYSLDLNYVDGVFGILIGLWIIRNGFKIGIENIDYLMGKRPSDDVLKKIKKAALAVKDVKRVNDIFAHYVGIYVHAEVHIGIDKKTSMKRSHNISVKVKDKIEDLGIVDRAFIHIDPV